MFFPSSAATIQQSNDAYGVLRALLTLRGADDGGLLRERAALLWPSAEGTQDDPPWSSLADEAEYHGVAPLIGPMIAALSATQTDQEKVGRVFGVLVRRHRRASTVREACIDELLLAFANAGLPIILLKGAALAHLLYPSPALRPMVDIDVLIATQDVTRASAIVRELGFSFADGHGSRFAGRMHHLPPATKDRCGFRITLEVHTDTMSPNQPERLTFATLSEPPQRFRRGAGPEGLALGHTDMLRHLTRHAFEPARRIRLIHLYDLWRYQKMLDHKVDWRKLASRFPPVIIALRLVSQVFSDESFTHGPGGTTARAVPAGLGLGMVPLSEIRTMNGGPAAKLDALLNPPAWWLHGFYAVPPDASLLICRTMRHPAVVSRWLTHRLLARIGLW